MDLTEAGDINRRWQEYWSGLPFLLQGIFSTQGLNLDLPHCRQSLYHLSYHFSPVQSLSRVRLFMTPWTAAHQASLSITNSRSLFKLMPIESVMPSSHLNLCRPLLLPPSILPSIRVFSRVKLVAAVELCSHAAYNGLAKKFLQF